MTAREYLEQVLKLDRLINSKLTELSRLRHNMESLSSPTLSSDKVRSGGLNNSMSTIDKIMDLERTIDSEIDKLVDLKAEIRSKIDRVYNPDFITVLTDKYINGYTLDQIAERMNVTPKTVYRWHGAALQIFRKETGMK